uniref:tRNA (adenine(58)-N(1))-methyltransferase non-catalytic subunit TRM6 n=1 Tax=Romanomermis culicivorax TaxID=13658 RepID=A0A915I2R9_ROMCU
DQLVEDNNKIDLENAQKLTAIDVKNLKDQGAKPSDLIAELAKNNKNFEHRTQYSKEKYLAKKKKKHSNVICIFKSTVRLLSHVYYHKDTDKICGLRLDHLSSILNYADVQPGTKVLVVENCAGLVTGGVLERLAGNGACLHFHRNDQAQAIPALNAMNFDEKQMSTFYPVSFKRLADNSIDLRENCESTTIVEDSQHKNEKKRERSQSPIIKESGEKSNEDESNERRRALRARREEAVKIFQESKFDSLIIACKQHPLTFLKHLTDKMEPSSPLVIYSLHVRLLLDCYTWLREQDIAINLRLSENFYRAHQVLPNRTHPEMNQLVAGGFLLTGIFVEK